MDQLADLARTELAVRLLTRNARVSIVHHETGLPLRRLRGLYRELHHRKPSSGQLPAMGCPVIQNRRQQVHASLFAGLYEAHGGPGIYQRTDIEALVRAYDTFLLMTEASGPPEIDFNVCWVVARDLLVGTSRLVRCAPCAIRYLASDNSRAPPNCPLCALYARSGVPKSAAAKRTGRPAGRPDSGGVASGT
jgi:hypothetical protein